MEMTQIEKTPAVVIALEKVGGSRWQKKGLDRVYFNDLAGWYGLELDHYKSRSVSAARLNGEMISNSRGRELESTLRMAKLWLDVRTGQFQSTGLSDAMFDTIWRAIAAAAQRGSR